jgi:hypothetical protein
MSELPTNELVVVSNSCNIIHYLADLILELDEQAKSDTQSISQ